MSLFEQVTLGASVLKHRIVLAPILQKHGDDELAKYCTFPDLLPGLAGEDEGEQKTKMQNTQLTRKQSSQ